MVLVDASVWIEVFRKRARFQLESAVTTDDIVTCLPVVQEVLQGFREERAFVLARDARRRPPQGCRAATAGPRKFAATSPEPRYDRFIGTPMSKRYMTEADLLSVEDDSCRHELVAGVIVAEPFPTPRHDRAVRRLRRLLEDFVEPQGLGEVFGEIGYVLARKPDTVRGPDLSFVSRARLTDFDEARFFSGAPDLAVEILSPSNRRGEMHSKVADYLAAGARLVWVVDPTRKSVTTYTTLLAPRRLEWKEVLDGEDVLPGLLIPLEAIFER